MTYDDNKSYASSAVGSAGLSLGIIGTTLASGILNGNGVGGLFGGNNSAITIAAKDAEIARLQSEANIGAKLNQGLVEVYSELRKQDKAQDANISALNSRVLALETAAPLREQIVLGQVNSVAQNLASNVAAINASIASTTDSLNASIASNTAALQCEINCIQKTLGGITATYVPATQVTPLPMSRYNYWQAPTTPETNS